MRCSGMLLCALALQLGAARAHDERDAQARRPQWTHATSSPYASPGPITDVGAGAAAACHEDAACLALAAQDRAGLEAITQLHRQLDDDANGNVDLSESDDFLREELQYDSGYEKRQRAFHHNDDMHISVRELWEAWLRSEVHNWTVEQTVEWLTASVDLPQYKTSFLQHKVVGATLPRLAVNNMQYLSNVLGIKDPIHKQKLALKAMDVVLFGPPKEGSRWKDWLLACLILGAVCGGWAALRAGRRSRSQLQRMLRDMEQLRRAEVALDDMQKELEKARLEQESATTEKRNLEKRLREAGDSPALTGASSDLEVSQLKQEIEMLRAELRRAEGELEDRCWAPPVGLQQWLQLTHEVENRSYMRKKQQADHQLQQAREACEKLKKKRSSLVGAFVSTHGKSIDDVDRSIVEARTALNEVTQELQERVHRWKQIEMLCGFNIINNNGLQYLESALYRTANGRAGRVRVSSSQDDLSVGDEAASLCGAVPESLGWREDSSGSETPEPPHYPLDLRLAEARHQLEERLAQEAREMKRADERRLQDEKRLSSDAMRAFEERRQEERKMASSEAWSERRAARGELRKSPGDGREGGGCAAGGVQFVLGGEMLSWPTDELARAALHSQSQPQLRASVRGAPLPPPRRPHPTLVPMVRSRSSDIMLPSPEEPRAPPRQPVFLKQKTLAEETGSLSDAPTAGGTPPEEESTDSSLVEDDTSSKPRRRKIHFPFTKKAKGLPA